MWPVVVAGSIAWVILGLALLVIGGEVLVRGASGLAIAARVSPLVVGLTVVAYGTSSPELAVSLQASLTGQADIAIGNAVGSNICNVLLVLGISALITPLVVGSRLIRFDVPLMIAASVLNLSREVRHPKALRRSGSGCRAGGKRSRCSPCGRRGRWPYAARGWS